MLVWNMLWGRVNPSCIVTSRNILRLDGLYHVAFMQMVPVIISMVLIRQSGKGISHALSRLDDNLILIRSAAPVHFDVARHLRFMLFNGSAFVFGSNQGQLLVGAYHK